jgi:oligo-1,6-glucosidase
MDISHMNGTWWREAVVYQIYPRSFMDSNGDGIGDLPGITSRLDYLKDLGVDVIWLSPIYASPNVDNGYDISDYRAIMTEFGTMADFDRMLAEIHKRGMRLIMDLVVNHSSDQHAWFRESRSSRDSAKRDYYIWRDPAPDGGPPNNWMSEFQGSAWTFDKETGQYYLHLFAPQQPDLNWENPALRREVYDMMAWWFEKGVDGFRMDVINFIAKAPGLPDAPPPADNPAARLVPPLRLTINHPGVHPLLQEMRRKVLAKYDVMTVGECHCVEPEDGPLYTSRSRGELDSIFQFDVTWLVQNRMLNEAMERLERWFQTCREDGWNTITFNNHDSRRIVSCAGDDGRYRVESAKCIATLLLTAPGTPYMLQGEELGMTDVRYACIEDHDDIGTRNRYRVLVEEEGMAPAEAFAKVRLDSRDNARTPMQWSAGKGGGFTTGRAWLKLNPNHLEINAEAAVADPDSIYHYYRRLIRLRKEHSLFVYGDFQPLPTGVAGVYAFERKLAGERATVLLNWTGEDKTLPVTEACAPQPGQRLVSSQKAVSADRLAPWEARILLYSVKP